MNEYCLSNGGYDDRFEAVVVCWNYGDFLQHTLRTTRGQFDRVVVVTHPDDTDTIWTCNRHSVTCIRFSEIQRDGVFCKGLAINRGLMELSQRGWICCLDADILVPDTLNNMLWKSALDRDCIYGVSRADVYGRTALDELLQQQSSYPQYQNDWFVAGMCNTSPQVVHREFGWIPVGFFQLWHSSYMHRLSLRYPSVPSGAGTVDVAWALNWPTADRRLLPTVNVLHLQSENCPMGANWRGRTTRRFE